MIFFIELVKTKLMWKRKIKRPQKAKAILSRKNSGPGIPASLRTTPQSHTNRDRERCWLRNRRGPKVEQKLETNHTLAATKFLTKMSKT